MNNNQIYSPSQTMIHKTINTISMLLTDICDESTTDKDTNQSK
jgi:hypothetical protein